MHNKENPPALDLHLFLSAFGITLPHLPLSTSALKWIIKALVKRLTFSGPSSMGWGTWHPAKGTRSIFKAVQSV